MRIAVLGCAVPMVTGCAVWDFNKDDEYARARNKIEGYEDREGNWVRPEGSRADKPGSSLPKFMQAIPGLGDRPINKELARTKYREADELFRLASEAQGTERRDLFRNAAKKYDDAGKDWINSALQQDAMFMSAESHFFAEDYPKAENQYVKLLKEYPRTRWQDKVDKRRLEIGDYWLQFPDKFYNINLTDPQKPINDTQNHGKRVLEKMLLDSPTSRLADDVTMEIANTEFKRENWNEAVDRYRDLITVYPESPFQFDAHFLGVKAALMAYQGPEYSSDSLEQADKWLSQMLKQFPEKSQGQIEKIREASAEVKYRKAERIFTQANYRANKEEYAAAKIYCEQIIADFDDTPFADQARAILAKAEGKPPVPTPYLNWMTKVFPTNDRVTPLLKPLPNATAAEPPSPSDRTASTPGGRMANESEPTRR
jgi:outer membrane protein assembly factor BamD (BamD/ComL family)